jgi:hypothetical protein
MGWREWLALPELGIPQIKAKVDTGARTSALHAFHIEYFEEGKVPMVRFQVHPLQRNTGQTITATAPVLDKRQVRNSGGHVQERPVIKTLVAIGEHQWPIELTLTNRDVMGFRMLLGREAVRRRFLVDPGGSYLLSQPADRSAPVDEIDEPDLP